MQEIRTKHLSIYNDELDKFASKNNIFHFPFI